MIKFFVTFLVFTTALTAHADSVQYSTSDVNTVVTLTTLTRNQNMDVVRNFNGLAHSLTLVVENTPVYTLHIPGTKAWNESLLEQTWMRLRSVLAILKNMPCHGNVFAVTGQVQDVDHAYVVNPHSVEINCQP